MFLVFIMLMGSLHPALASQTRFVGCLNRLPNGTLQLGAVPSGQLFIIRGSTNALEEHVNQLVRVFGASSPRGSNDNVLPTLIVNRVQAVAESCTSILPGQQFESVPGKVGEDLVAVPVTSTPTEAETTPGFQTEAATGSRSQSVPLSWTAEPPAAPAHPDQVAQSEAAANVNSSAVERTEILPGATLGVGLTAGSKEPQSARAELAAAGSGTVHTRNAVVTISGHQTPQLSPAKVEVKVGQSVAWRNSSGTVQEVVANPARGTRASNATLPADARPFDSGFLRPGHSFRHTFSVPGVYRYFCKVNGLNNSAQVTGEVVVER